MQLAVLDTSELIDVERGALLDASFRLAYQFVVPDSLYEQELRSTIGTDLQGRGLTIRQLSPGEAQRGLAYRRRYQQLSLSDCFALALAQSQQAILLSGDRQLRDIAEQEGVACHGVLWLLDEIESAGTASRQELHAGLVAMSQHPRSRLPQAEVASRLAGYAAQLP